MKRLVKAVRPDRWDRVFEDAVSDVLQSGETEFANCDVAAVIGIVAATFGVSIAPKADDAKALFKRLALEPVNRLSARRGDVGLITFEGKTVAGVVSGVGFVVRLPHGASIFPVSEIEQAYKIGV